MAADRSQLPTRFRLLQYEHSMGARRKAVDDRGDTGGFESVQVERECLFGRAHLASRESILELVFRTSQHRRSSDDREGLVVDGRTSRASTIRCRLRVGPSNVRDQLAALIRHENEFRPAIARVNRCLPLAVAPPRSGLRCDGVTTRTHTAQAAAHEATALSAGTGDLAARRRTIAHEDHVVVLLLRLWSRQRIQVNPLGWLGVCCGCD